MRLCAALWLWLSCFALASVVQDAEHEIPLEQHELINPEEARSLNTEDVFYDQLQSIRTSWKRSPVLVLDEDENMLQELAGNTSPANFAVLFVARSEGCQVVKRNFEALAQSYWQDLERGRRVSTSKLFFFVANSTKSTKLFRAHRVSKVPTLVLIPQGAPYPLPGEEFPEEWKLDPSMSDWSDLAGWLSSQTGIRVSSQEGSGILSTDTLESFERYGRVIIAIQIGAIVLVNIDKFQYKTAWLIVSMAAYFFSVSGSLFCLLRGVPPLGYTEQTGIMFFYPDRSNQFLLEGLVVGVLHTLVSVSLVVAGFNAQGVDCLAQLETMIQGEDAEESERHESPIERYQRLIKNASLCLVICSVVFINVIIFFRRKAPWYHPLRW